MKWILSVALSLLVLLLSWQNVRLRAERDRLVIENSTPRVGQWMPPAQRVLVAPAQSTDDFGKIYVFLEPNCSYCGASLPALEALYGAVKKDFSDKYSFVAVSSQKYDLEQQKVSFQILTTSDPALLSYPRVYGTPLIIVANAQGMIVHARAGVLSDMEGANGIIRARADMERGHASNRSSWRALNETTDRETHL